MMTMSATQMARQAIPIRRVVINHESEMPLDYGTTPGGTMFGTTPGGTRIVYERNFLLQMRQSPLSHTPPSNLPKIPGVTAPKENKTNNNNKAGTSPNDNSKNVSSSAKTANGGAALRGSSPPKSNRVPASIKEEEEQFSMDM